MNDRYAAERAMVRSALLVSVFLLAGCEPGEIDTGSAPPTSGPEVMTTLIGPPPPDPGLAPGNKGISGKRPGDRQGGDGGGTGA